MTLQLIRIKPMETILYQILGNGMWGMYAGDGDSNGIVNVLDYGMVGNFLFETGYKSGDSGYEWSY